MRLLVAILALVTLGTGVAGFITVSSVDPVVVTPPSTVAPTSTTSSSTSMTSTTVPPVRARRLVVHSTAYCLTTPMSSGPPAHDGAVASNRLHQGSSWRVLEGAYAGRVLRVEDTGPLADFDIAMPGRCDAAWAYGAHAIEIEEVRP